MKTFRTVNFKLMSVLLVLVLVFGIFGSYLRFVKADDPANEPTAETTITTTAAPDTVGSDGNDGSSSAAGDDKSGDTVEQSSTTTTVGDTSDTTTDGDTDETTTETTEAPTFSDDNGSYVMGDDGASKIYFQTADAGTGDGSTVTFYWTYDADGNKIETDDKGVPLPTAETTTLSDDNGTYVIGDDGASKIYYQTTQADDGTSLTVYWTYDADGNKIETDDKGVPLPAVETTTLSDDNGTYVMSDDGKSKIYYQTTQADDGTSLTVYWTYDEAGNKVDTDDKGVPLPTVEAATAEETTTAAPTTTTPGTTVKPTVKAAAAIAPVAAAAGTIDVGTSSDIFNIIPSGEVIGEPFYISEIIQNGDSNKLNETSITPKDIVISRLRSVGPVDNSFRKYTVTLNFTPKGDVVINYTGQSLVAGSINGSSQRATLESIYVNVAYKNGLISSVNYNDIALAVTNKLTFLTNGINLSDPIANPNGYNSATLVSSYYTFISGNSNSNVTVEVVGTQSYAEFWVVKDGQITKKLIQIHNNINTSPLAYNSGGTTSNDYCLVSLLNLEWIGQITSDGYTVLGLADFNNPGNPTNGKVTFNLYSSMGTTDYNWLEIDSLNLSSQIPSGFQIVPGTLKLTNTTDNTSPISIDETKMSAIGRIDAAKTYAITFDIEPVAGSSIYITGEKNATISGVISNTTLWDAQTGGNVLCFNSSGNVTAGTGGNPPSGGSIAAGIIQYGIQKFNLPPLFYVGLEIFASPDSASYPTGDELATSAVVANPTRSRTLANEYTKIYQGKDAILIPHLYLADSSNMDLATITCVKSAGAADTWTWVSNYGAVWAYIQFNYDVSTTWNNYYDISQYTANWTGTKWNGSAFVNNSATPVVGTSVYNVLIGSNGDLPIIKPAAGIYQYVFSATMYNNYYTGITSNLTSPPTYSKTSVILEVVGGTLIVRVINDTAVPATKLNTVDVTVTAPSASGGGTFHAACVVDGTNKGEYKVYTDVSNAADYTATAYVPYGYKVEPGPVYNTVYNDTYNIGSDIYTGAYVITIVVALEPQPYYYSPNEFRGVT